MKRHIFASKPKKTIKTPLYYNIQVSVDKDYVFGDGFPDPETGGKIITLYANEPVVFVFNGDKEDWENESKRTWHYDQLTIEKRSTHTSMYYGAESEIVCEGIYPIPEIVSRTVYPNTIFTYTPIPVYE